MQQGSKWATSCGVICFYRLVINKTFKKSFETIRLTTQVSRIGSLSLLLLWSLHWIKPDRHNLFEYWVSTVERQTMSTGSDCKFQSNQTWVYTACSGFCLNSMVKYGKFTHIFKRKKFQGVNLICFYPYKPSIHFMAH